MVDAISKFLVKLDKKDKQLLVRIIEDIISEKLSSYDIKKLAGNTDTFRIRKGKYRIIFKKYENHVEILEVERRSDTTYSKY